jgi:hypothetical protein
MSGEVVEDVSIEECMSPPVQGYSVLRVCLAIFHFYAAVSFLVMSVKT